MNWEIHCGNMCRACMKTDGVLLSMYDNNTIRHMNLPHKLAELASIQIDKSDYLPKMLCSKCAYRTDTFYNFKQQVQETQEKLKVMFEKQMLAEKEERKKKVPHEKINEDNITKTEKSIKLKLSNEQTSVHNTDFSENVKMEDEIKKNEQNEIDICPLYENNSYDKNSNLHLYNVLSDLQEVDEDQVAIHSVKTKIPQEISKILESQQRDYTIMYIRESMIESITGSTTENSLGSDIEQEKIENEHIFVETVEDISGQENIEETLDDIHVFEPVESTVTMNKKRKIQQMLNDENTSNIEETSKAENSNDSDSDYFIDHKDNILGSLNDTITRIKEVRKGDSIEHQCTLCLQNYAKLTDMLLHIIDNHVPSSGPFFCVVCEKDCESHRELRAHAKTHTGRFPYSCFICEKAYSMKRYLKRHMVCHTDFPRHRCPKCGARFKDKSEMESHVTTHIHGVPFACSQCSRVFNHKGNYKRHLISHLDPQGLQLPKYPCQTCGKRFLNNRTLETHTRIHTGEKPFSCEICGKSFSQKGNLLNHARIHSNPRRYTCEICGKRFNQHATLKDHRLIHTGEKPHVCNVCGVSFTFSAALRRHMWIHSDGKPFGCDKCGARFVGKYDLRRHMQVHTDRPKLKRKKNNGTSKANDYLQEEVKEEDSAIMEEPDAETVLIEQVLLPQDVTQVVHQAESEKENVDALFNLIQYD